MTATLLAALAAGLTTVVFLIGFASVRLRGQRDRALSRSDAIANGLSHRSAEGKLITDRDVERTADAYAEANRLDPMGRWTVVATWIIVMMMLVLSGIAAAHAAVPLTLLPMKWSFESWSVGFVIAVAIGVAVIGSLEFRWVRNDLTGRLQSSPIGRVRIALHARSEKKLAPALECMNDVITQLDYWPWAFAFRAKLHAELGSPARALADLDQALSLDPEQVWHRVARAEILLEQDDSEKALSDLEYLGPRMPAEPEVLRLLGSALYGVGRRDDALQAFSEALLAEPNHVSTRIARGRALAQGTHHEADTPADALRTILLDEGQRIAVANVASKARERLFETDLRTAIEDFSMVLEHDPGNADALVFRGHALLRLGQLSEAESDFEQALHQQERRAFVYANMAFAYRSMGHRDRAIDLFSEAIAIRDTSAARFQRGLTQHSLRNYERAIEDFDASLRLSSRHYEAGSHRALSLSKLGMFEEADLQFRDIELAVPENTHNLMLWVQSLVIDRKDLATALEVANRAVERTPFDGTLYSIRGRVHASLNRYASAHADFDSAETLGADAQLVALDRATALLDADDLEAAEQALTLADAAASPYRYAVLATKATVLRRLGRLREAWESYTEAIDIGTDVARLLVSRGCLSMSMNDYEPARADFDRALTLDVNSRDALSHRAELLGTLGEHEAAEADLARFEELGGARSVAEYLRGHAHFTRREWEEAATHFQRALSESAGYRQFDLMSSLAAVFDNLGEFADAEALFRRILAEDRSPSARLRLGICLSQQHKADEARLLFRSVRAELGDAAQQLFDANVLPEILLESEAVLEIWRSTEMAAEPPSHP